MKHFYSYLLIVLLIFACSDDQIESQKSTKNLTLFFVNDQHGQLSNFAKIKHIIDKEKETQNVIVACSGDIFSGNPVVDNYIDKGYPMIDIMNQVGFDISVLGNHEFDYGEDILKKRLEQAEFDWVCANIDMGSTGLLEPFEFKTIEIDNLRITFLGLVETNGKPNEIIPLTHPWRVQNFTFEKPEDVVARYVNTKEREEADLFIALTHIGHFEDFRLADEYPFFDLIIGGHSHQQIDAVHNNIPIFQSGSYLNHLGKIELIIDDHAIKEIDFELIDLNSYTNIDTDLKTLIDQYDANASYLTDIIGFSELQHNRSQVGCFYTDALRNELNVDVTFQNSGGVRNSLDQGDITIREIFEIDPFNNGTVIYTLSVEEIKSFLIGSASGFYYSGILIYQDEREIKIEDLNGNRLPDGTSLTVAINDYIPAVYDSYFPQNKVIHSLTTAENIISYLENGEGIVNYPSCSRFFRYQQ